jgi:hypothetical protein
MTGLAGSTGTCRVTQVCSADIVSQHFIRMDCVNRIVIPSSSASSLMFMRVPRNAGSAEHRTTDKTKQPLVVAAPERPRSVTTQRRAMFLYAIIHMGMLLSTEIR